MALLFGLMGCSSKEDSLPVSPVTYGESEFLPVLSDEARLVVAPCLSQEALAERGDWPLEEVGTLLTASPSPVTQDEIENGVEFVKGTVVEDGSGQEPVFAKATPREPGAIYIPFEDGCYSEYDIAFP